jgi:ubiquinone/menaquinone biosynthesis C-methylase UbiE
VTHLYPRLKALAGHCTILDIGTGDGSLPRTIAQWSLEKQQPVTVIGLDLMVRHLEIAQDETASQDNIEFIQADATCLPYADNSVDYVICSLLLHHFTRRQAVALLKDAYRCARHGIIISDLVRGWFPYIGYKLIQPFFRLHPITRQDGETSIKRGFTPSELAAMAQAADLSTATIHHHPLFRMTLVADK